MLRGPLLSLLLPTGEAFEAIFLVVVEEVLLGAVMYGADERERRGEGALEEGYVKGDGGGERRESRF